MSEKQNRTATVSERPTCLRPALAAAICMTLAACTALDLGPEPSNTVAPAQAVPTTTPAYDLAAPGPVSTAPAPQSAPMKLSIQDAILAVLRNNPSLKVERYNVPLRRTLEEEQRAAFDPSISGQVAGGRTRSPVAGRFADNDTINGQVGVQQFFPTGTTVGLDGAVQYATNSFYNDGTVVTRGGLTINQSLLRGGDLDANLALLREAQLDTKSSQYELRGFAEALIAQLEQAYWDYAFAQRGMEIVQAALQVAEQQLAQAKEFIRVGRIAETELAAAEAEVALRREALINARSILNQARLRVLQLTTAPDSAAWTRPLQLVDQPFVPQGTLDDVENHVRIALDRRPEINQAKLAIKRGELEVVRTRNGLLPKLDLFVTLGKSGYANSFGGSIENLNGQGYDVLVGVRGEYALENRAARAQFRRATLSKEQSAEALNNLTQTVQVDVRSAYIEVVRTREQIQATTASRIAQETKARVEVEKFRVGKSTSLLVAQAQRDLLNSQIDEVQAVVNHLKALVSLYRLEGSLLDRRYIGCHARL